MHFNGSQVEFSEFDVFHSLKVVLILTYSADPINEGCFFLTYSADPVTEGCFNLNIVQTLLLNVVLRSFHRNK